MSKDKISDYSSTANSNTDIAGINIDEGCAPSGINDAIRTLMAQLKTWQSGGQDVYIHPAGSASAPSITANGDTNTGIFFPAADTVGITTGGTERARVDSSGNLGLGVTPSAWGAGLKAIQIGATTSLYNSGNNGVFGVNFYNDGTNTKYLQTAAAGYFGYISGTWAWGIAGSGTAGTNATLTQAMTLDASGNLGVGTTSPSTRLNVAGPVTVNGAALAANQTSAAVIDYQSTVQAARFFAYGAGSVGQFNWYQGSGGNNPTQTMTLDSSGNLLVGTTSLIANSEKVSITQSANANAFVTYNGSASQTASLWIAYANRNTTNNTFNVMQYYNSAAGVTRFLIADSGNVTNTNGSYGAISDIKSKENIVDATPKLEKLQQVRVVNYNLIGDTQKQLGVIAQELEQIFPGMVEEAPDRDAEGNDIGTKTKSVKYSVFVPMLIKAIQEQQAIITALTARIEALEQA